MTTLSSFAQSPQNINYQAVVRNNAGDVIKNQSVRFRLSVTEGANGVTTYSETHSPTTNNLGLVNLTIGTGTVATGTFAAINWATGAKFLKVEVDAAGGTNYTLTGTQQFASVPYALHAQSATNAWTLNGNSVTSNNSLGTTNAQDLRLITNNTVSAVLKSNGQFGLGTTTPTGWLTIEKTADGSNFDDDRNFIILRDKSNTSGSTAVMRIYSGQSGTFTALNHHASSYFLNDFADFGQLWASGKGLILRAGASTASAPNISSIRFMTGFRSDGGSNERMIITPTGNIGIGTSSPISKLTIEGNESGDVPSGTPDPRRFMSFKNTSSDLGSVVYASFEAGPSGNQTSFSHHSSTYFLNSLADHGQVMSTGKGLVLRAFPKNNNGTDGVIKFMTGVTPDGSNSIERMKITADGNVGIGTSDPKAKLHLEGNTTGNESTVYDAREYLHIQNNSNSIGSAASLSITAGSNAGSTYLWHVAPSYTPRPQDQDFTILYSSGKGMSFWNSPKGNTANGGYFKFQTGVKPDNTGGFDRLVINNVGNVGIGNSDPKAKLEVKDGDVYVNDPTKGIILKSPNGSCWRVTIDNTGNFVRTAITCPN